jgi:hypothetical protein
MNKPTTTFPFTPSVSDIVIDLKSRRLPERQQVLDAAVNMLRVLRGRSEGEGQALLAEFMGY